jgi:hypothetical protein
MRSGRALDMLQKVIVYIPSVMLFQSAISFREILAFPGKTPVVFLRNGPSYNVDWTVNSSRLTAWDR